MAEDVAPIPVSLNREATSNINDNYLVCPTLSRSTVTKLDQRTVTRTVKPKVIDGSVLDKVQMTSNFNSRSVSYLVVDHAHSVCFQGQPQKKGISPCTQKIEIKDVEGVSCASQCLFAPHVPNVPNVVPSLAVGGRLQKFWHIWLDRTHKQVGGRKSGDKVLPGLLQPPFSGTKIQPQMEAYLGPRPSKLILETRHLQDGNNKVVSPKRGMGNVAGLQRCLFLHPHQSEIPEVPQVFSREDNLSIYGPSFRSSHSSTGIYQGSQGGETDGSSTGYPDPPVLRQLVSQSPRPGNLPTAYPDPLGPVPRTTLGGKHGEIGTYVSTGFQFRRLLARSSVRSGFAHSGQMGHSSAETTVHQRQEKLLSQTVHVSNRTPYCNRETGMGRSPPHETRSVAPEATLACTRESGKDYSHSPLSIHT